MTRENDFIRKIYDTHADEIYRFLFWQTGDQALAEDLTSEVFYRAWKHQSTLQEGNPRAWLYRVGRNLVTDHHRKKKEQPLDDSYEPIGTDNLHEEAIRQEEILRLRKLVMELTPVSRSVIILRFFEQLSAQEVADIMNKTPGNVRILQYRALKELKARFTSHEKQPRI